MSKLKKTRKKSKFIKPKTFSKKSITLNENITNKEFIFGDIDSDGIPNIDDLVPLKKSSRTVEEILLHDELLKLEQNREKLFPIMDEVASKLEELNIGEVLSRIKTRNSTINKLRRRYLEERLPEIYDDYEGNQTGSVKEFKNFQGLTDVIGTMVIVNDLDELLEAKRAIQKNFGVIAFDNYYARPKNGYRAYHFIIDNGGIPVEIQLKTRRNKLISDYMHTAYKQDKLDVEESSKFFLLAYKADKGNKEAQEEFDKIDFKKEFGVDVIETEDITTLEEVLE